MDVRCMGYLGVDDAMADVLRRKSGSQRLAIMNLLYRSAWRLIETNIRSTHQDWDKNQVRREIAADISGGTN
jgi:hypothetical protein